MRVAAIYDIHGNLPALEAVLEEIRHAEVDRVVVGGDVVPGPMPRETIARLLSVQAPADFIRGNCEVAVLEEIAGRPTAVPEQVRGIIQWTARELSAEENNLLASWTKTLSLKIPGLGDVLFCHGTPRDENEIFTRLTPEERLLPIFEEVNASVVVCSHTHMQFDRMVGRTRVVNAGSVGMPFGKPGADWLLLGDGVELRHTDYDLAAAADRIRGTKYIEAEDFAARYVLNPPSEEQMLDLFERGAVGRVR
ncbi:MAG TPA: metallophosphoesterase family protein [Candidatus Acidoferrales bacterium]|nr:metallophosphoesterase family protein [Candidatus Acidoferrales bacterium]